MNRLILDDLQRRTAYPSVTLLLNTARGRPLDPEHQRELERMVATVDRRLDGDVDDETRREVVATLERLVATHRQQPATAAMAICASPDHAAVVRLGRQVRPRVVVDDTFATRDLVADLNRTAAFRVVTTSERRVRVLLGDRQRLVEQRDEAFPLLREDDEGASAWARRTDAALAAAHADRLLPTVVAGVAKAARAAAAALPEDQLIGVVPGNHDRTSWAELHTLAWPLVTDWLRADQVRALARLEQARSSRRYAGGIDEVFPLASEGRVELVIVEDGYAVAARVGPNLELERADDAEAPDVVDDVVDDAIEAVLRHGGEAVIVGDGDLEDLGRVAAVLRY